MAVEVGVWTGAGTVADGAGFAEIGKKWHVSELTGSATEIFN